METKNTENKKNVTIDDAMMFVTTLQDLGFVNAKFIIGGSLALKQYGLLNRDCHDVDLIVKIGNNTPNNKVKLDKRLRAIAVLTGGETGYGSTLDCGKYLRITINGISACVWFTFEGYDDTPINVGVGVYLNSIKDIIEKKRSVMKYHMDKCNYEKFIKHLVDIEYIKSVIG